MKRIAQILLRKAPADGFVRTLNPLLIRSLRTVYEYWLKEEDPLAWLARIADGSPGVREKGQMILHDISHRCLREYLKELEQASAQNGSSEILQRLLALPATSRSSAPIRRMPHHFPGTGKRFQRGGEAHLLKNWKILALFKIMEMEGCHDIHEEILREINYTLVQLIRQGAAGADGGVSR